jgi:hypothetical protein
MTTTQDTAESRYGTVYAAFVTSTVTGKLMGAEFRDRPWADAPEPARGLLPHALSGPLLTMGSEFDPARTEVYGSVLISEDGKVEAAIFTTAEPAFEQRNGSQIAIIAARDPDRLTTPDRFTIMHPHPGRSHWEVWVGFIGRDATRDAYLAASPTERQDDMADRPDILIRRTARDILVAQLGAVSVRSGAELVASWVGEEFTDDERQEILAEARRMGRELVARANELAEPGRYVR